MGINPHYKKGQIVVGLFYMTAEGTEVYLCGHSTRDGVSFYTKDGGTQIASEEVAKEWTPLDLVEFTGEKDHRLPYVFDLNWDCKTVSQMIRSLESGDFEEMWHDEDVLLQVLDDPGTFGDPRYHVTAEDIQAIKKVLGRA